MSIHLKKLRNLTLAALFFTMMFVLPVSAAPTTTTYKLGSTVTAHSNTYYKFVAPETGIITLTDRDTYVMNGYFFCGSKTNGQFFDRNAAQFRFSADQAAFCWKNQFAVEKGQTCWFYVKSLRNYEPKVGLHKPQFRLNLTKMKPGANTSRAKASKTVEVPCYAFFTPSNASARWYKISVVRSNTVLGVSTEKSSDASNLAFSFYDAKGVLISSRSVKAPDPQIDSKAYETKKPLTKGTYYVKVTPTMKGISRLATLNFYHR